MSPPNIKDLLLAPRLEPKHVAELLRPYGLKDPVKADRNLQATATDPSERQLLADVIEELLVCVSQSADPDQALTYFERFATAALNKTRLFSYFKDSPPTLEILTRTLGGSPYMAEILIRDPHHFYWVTDPQILHKGRTKRDIQRELVRTLKVLADEKQQLNYLRVLKRREMLQIGVRDLLRMCSVEETLSALSTLAEVLISATYWICSTSLKKEHQISKKSFRGFSILAMGKLGGGELNFSSDVDLIYLYAANQVEPSTDNPSDTSHETMSAPDYFHRLCQKITIGLSDFTEEGYVYRVDLRLRPEGAAGNIADTIESFERYYASRLGTWERLALLKAWPVAGNCGLAKRFLAMARPFVYDPPFDLKALDDIRAMKRKVDRQMTIRRQGARNVKLGRGGIREVELVTQSLQVCHGGRYPQLSQRNTLKALSELCERALISAEECATLTQAYVFLRDVENKLQMVDDAQTHLLPRNREDLMICARRLGYTDKAEDLGVDLFLRDYQHYTNEVHRIFEEVIGLHNTGRFYPQT